jgi:hypothetical protein
MAWFSSGPSMPSTSLILPGDATDAPESITSMDADLLLEPGSPFACPSSTTFVSSQAFSPTLSFISLHLPLVALLSFQYECATCVECD